MAADDWRVAARAGFEHVLDAIDMHPIYGPPPVVTPPTDPDTIEALYALDF